MGMMAERRGSGRVNRHDRTERVCEIAGIDWENTDLFDRMFRAVEWFENRPSGGDSPGWRFFSCCVEQRVGILPNPADYELAAPVDPSDGAQTRPRPVWAKISEPDQKLYEEMAAVLFEHKGSRRE